MAGVKDIFTEEGQAAIRNAVGADSSSDGDVVWLDIAGEFVAVERRFVDLSGRRVCDNCQVVLERVDVPIGSITTCDNCGETVKGEARSHD